MSDEQLLRYSRQVMVPGFDIEGQEKLLASSALLVGVGGLGCPAAMYLAAAGIGRLVLADGDHVELTNLQRQIAHNENTVGQLKTESARKQILAINSACQVELLNEQLQGEKLLAAVADVDIVLDCSDNFVTRFALNKACVERKKPLVSAAAIRAEGQLAVFDANQHGAACYQCLYKPDKTSDSEAPSCSENGVLAPLVGILGAMQAMEALKLLAGYGKPALGKLLVFDATCTQWREFALQPDPECEICAAEVRHKD